MREIRHIVDIDRYLEDAARLKHQLDAERWRKELRPRALRLFAGRTTTLTWSRAVLKLVVGELFPDDLFTELIGNLDRVPRRRWPQVIAIALALRHSWRRDGLERMARRLRVRWEPRELPTSGPHATRRDSPVRAKKAPRARARPLARAHPRASPPVASRQRRRAALTGR